MTCASCWILTAGSRLLDPHCWIPTAGSPLLDPDCWILTAGSSLLDPNLWTRLLDPNCWIPIAGRTREQLEQLGPPWSKWVARRRAIRESMAAQAGGVSDHARRDNLQAQQAWILRTEDEVRIVEGAQIPIYPGALIPTSPAAAPARACDPPLYPPGLVCTRRAHCTPHPAAEGWRESPPTSPPWSPPRVSNGGPPDDPQPCAPTNELLGSHGSRRGREPSSDSIGLQV